MIFMVNKHFLIYLIKSVHSLESYEGGIITHILHLKELRLREFRSKWDHQIVNAGLGVEPCLQISCHSPKPERARGHVKSCLCWYPLCLAGWMNGWMSRKLPLFDLCNQVMQNRLQLLLGKERTGRTCWRKGAPQECNITGTGQEFSPDVTPTRSLYRLKGPTQGISQNRFPISSCLVHCPQPTDALLIGTRGTQIISAPSLDSCHLEFFVNISTPEGSCSPQAWGLPIASLCCTGTIKKLL